ncbi:MAG: beta-propeller fold lactonase family protein [Deltaproteobacteria bacterium]|nr:beta-propeller fold lactonase family protein [Deltaproteobacteria bacterium]
MRQVIAFSLKCINVNPGGFLLFVLFSRGELRCSAVASMVGIVALVFFPFSLSHATPVLYVPTQLSDSVSIIDGNTYSAIKTITVGQDPYGVGVSPDGKTVLITNMAADTVSVIDTDTNTVTKTISVGDFPFGVVVSPDGRYAYVANAADDNISVIDTSGYSVVAHITVGDDPHGLVIHPDGSKLYVTNYFGSTVSVINTSTYSVIKTITVGTYPHGIAIHPSGTYVYTANVLDNTLSVISTSSNSVIKTVNTGEWPFFPAIDPSGQYLYVSNHASSSVTAVDISSNSVVGKITVGSGPHGISLDATGSRAYVANESDSSVSVIDTASRTVITTISVGKTPIAFGNFVAEPRIPSPKGANVFTPYTDSVLPFRDSDPSKAKPIGMGTIAGVGSILSLLVGANEFSSPMDVYLGLSMPAIDPSKLYLFTSAGLKPISAGFLPWKSSVTDISGVVVSEYDALLLPTGNYAFFLRVVPAGTPAANLSMNYYQWSASLSVVRASDVAVKAIALFGSDSAAAAAIFLAIDNGFSIDQIVAAIDAGTLSFIGEIQGQSNTSSGLRTGKWVGLVAEKYCGHLDPEFPLDKAACAGIIEAVLEELQNGEFTDEERAGVGILMLRDVGYSSAQIDLLNSDGEWLECHRVVNSFEIKCCDYTKCWIVEPNFQPTDTLSETAAKICPLLGVNRDPRVISKNPFMLSQAASPILGLNSASSSSSCTPICTDSDGDGYYVQSGCGTGGAVDCNDGNRNINPAVPESCADGIDNNCDGKIDTLDPGCSPSGSCSNPSYPTPCGSKCYQAGAICCGGEHACGAEFECCGSGCMEAGYVCCAPIGYCPPGNTCDYENEKCISSGAGVSEFLNQCTEWQPVLEGPINDYFAIKDIVD